MTEEHVMDVRWSGDHAIALALKDGAAAHECTVEVEQTKEATTVFISVSDADLQRLRDRVDALLVDLSEIEERMNG
jgi:hypothetical protein